jgi:hypothetical protein
MCSNTAFKKNRNLLGHSAARTRRLPAGGVKRDKNKEDFTSFFRWSSGTAKIGVGGAKAAKQ